jgi:hypothetical protein
MPNSCYICGIIIGENQLESTAYRWHRGYVCGNCNETYNVKKHKLTQRGYNLPPPIRYLEIKEKPPFAYHISNIELRMAIRRAILLANWYVWIQEKFLITWMPVDIYQELINGLKKGVPDATSKSPVR